MHSNAAQLFFPFAFFTRGAAGEKNKRRDHEKAIEQERATLHIRGQTSGSTNQSQSNYGPAIEQSTETQTPSRLQQAQENRRQGEETKAGVIEFCHRNEADSFESAFCFGHVSLRFGTGATRGLVRPFGNLGLEAVLPSLISLHDHRGFQSCAAGFIAVAQSFNSRAGRDRNTAQVSAEDFSKDLGLRVMSANSKQKIFLIWAVSATVAAVVALSVAFFLFMRLRELSVARDLSETAGVATNATDASPFLTLKESDIPGRWRWKHPNDEYIMTLYPDHTFSNKGGDRLPVYRWEILPDGFLLVWSRGTTRFTVMESPRAFISPSQGRQKTVRLEKVD